MFRTNTRLISHKKLITTQANQNHKLSDNETQKSRIKPEITNKEISLKYGSKSNPTWIKTTNEYKITVKTKELSKI